ncbi:MAG: hypothetical protein HYY90_02495 [Candidatus Omnitrophica bacterium]|nr:hypothetical protein [Candidatus Omnitrophota bacterium]
MAKGDDVRGRHEEDEVRVLKGGDGELAEDGARIDDDERGSAAEGFQEERQRGGGDRL